MRRIGASVLVVLAAILLLLSSYGWWAKRYFLESERFSDKATEIIDQEAVQQALAVVITDQITEASGHDLAVAQPFITSIVRELVDSPAFQTLFDQAVLRLHRAVVGGGARSAVLDLSATVNKVKNALEPIAPNLADNIPDGREVQVKLLTKSQLQTVYDVTDIVKKVVIVLTVLTILCFAGGIALSPRRWRAAALAGWVILGGFVVSLVLVRTGRSIVGSLSSQQEYSDAGEASYKVITHGLVVQGIVFAVLGLLLALGAGWTDRHGGWAAVKAKTASGIQWIRAQVPQKQPAPELAGDAVVSAPSDHPAVSGLLAARLPAPSRKVRTAHWWRAAALLLVGIFAVWSPASLTSIVVVLLGFVALYLAVTEALAAWGSPKEPPTPADPTSEPHPVSDPSAVG